MAIKKGEITSAITGQKNEFQEKEKKIEEQAQALVNIPAPYVKESKRIRLNNNFKGRPTSMAGNERVRISLYISGVLDKQIESLLDKNVETKNQLCNRLLQIGCQALQQQKNK